MQRGDEYKVKQRSVQEVGAHKAGCVTLMGPGMIRICCAEAGFLSRGSEGRYILASLKSRSVRIRLSRSQHPQSSSFR